MGRKRRRSQPYAAERPVCIDHHTNSSLSPEILGSPHVEQCRGAFIRRRPAAELPRVLPHGASPRLPYRRREAEPKSTVHWGQRKLLISEIEFLSQFGRPAGGDICCVYIGAAPGRHIPFLSQLFPEIEFILIDPSSFCIGDTDKISIRNEFATPALCSSFSGRAAIVLCLSDLRTADWRLMDAAGVERAVQEDMQLQRACVEALRPAAALLKFRLPYYRVGTVEYLDGEVRLPVWGPQTTTESRLLVQRSEAGSYDTREWDIRKYNQEMFYFNTITRVNTFDHSVKSRGLDYCYDCAAEVTVLKQYSVNGTHANDIALHPNKLGNIIGKLVRKVSLACSLSGKRDLENWKSGNQFELKVYDRPTGSLVVVNGGAEAGHNEPLSAEDVCMAAWRTTSAFGTASWCVVDEDVLVAGDRNQGWTYVYGANGFGLDIPLDSPVTCWVWAVLCELFLLCSDVPVLDSAEAGALEGLRCSTSATARYAVCAALGLHEYNAPPEVPMCPQCENRNSGCVGVSRARAILLFCRTGNVYIVWVDIPGSCITKVVLPTFTMQHATAVSATIHIHYYSKGCEKPPSGCGGHTDHPIAFECCRQILFNKILAVDGKPIDSNAASTLNEFVKTQLCFDGTVGDTGDTSSLAGGSEVLLHAGFHRLSTVDFSVAPRSEP